MGAPMTEQEERDERAIVRVLNLYAVAMDARRWDLFDHIFTQDVVARYPKVEWTDLPTFKQQFAEGHAKYDATQHAPMTPLVEIDGDSACSFSYVSLRLFRLGTEGGDSAGGHGWYDDHWRRTSEGWRISERNCRILWADGNPAVRGARRGLEWNPMRIDAAEGKIGFLTMFDKRHGN